MPTFDAFVVTSARNCPFCVCRSSQTSNLPKLADLIQQSINIDYVYREPLVIQLFLGHKKEDHHKQCKLTAHPDTAGLSLALENTSVDHAATRIERAMQPNACLCQRLMRLL